MECVSEYGNAVLPERHRALRMAAMEAFRRVLATPAESPERARAEADSVAACLAIRAFHAELTDHAPTVEMLYLRDCAAVAKWVARTAEGPERAEAERHAAETARIYRAYHRATFGPTGPDRTVKFRSKLPEREEIPMRDIDFRYQAHYFR